MPVRHKRLKPYCLALAGGSQNLVLLQHSLEADGVGGGPLAQVITHSDGSARLREVLAGHVGRLRYDPAGSLLPCRQELHGGARLLAQARAFKRIRL